MEFRIADTFIDSLVRLTGQEQKAVKTTAFDLQLNPASPGIKFHKLEKCKDPNFWSAYVNVEIRLIVHRSKSSLLLCYVAHHDKAYEWAERRKLETHPKTGAAQIVEVRESVQEYIVRKYVDVESHAPELKRKLKTANPLLFEDVSADELLSYGVPQEWLEDVKQTTEDSLFELVDHLPHEAAEALLNLATGSKPHLKPLVPEQTDPFAHPDAQRRFRVMNNLEELEQALAYPWDKWTVFLHPSQKELVEQNYTGSYRVSGSAGTGKTIVALHRAVFLARKNSDSRILLTTFSKTLANALQGKLKRLISHEPKLAERLEVESMNELGLRLYERYFVKPNIANQTQIQDILSKAAQTFSDAKFTIRFLFNEWEQIVDAWQLTTWESYRDVVRLGRKTRLPENRRTQLWSIFEQVRAELKAQGLTTMSTLFNDLAQKLAENKNPPYDFAIIDEAQDISVAQLRFLAALAGSRPNSLFFCGDQGQRIFQQPFSWKALGVNIQGRSRNLQINYRTSHQIRRQADRLLSKQVSDVDGNTEERNHTISVFNGPQPTVMICASQKAELETVKNWLMERKQEGLIADEIGVFVRSDAEIERACFAVEAAGFKFRVLSENMDTASGQVSICTMHLAKGLEFRAVVVMACDDEVIPHQERIESVTDDSDLEEVYNTERHLLYVACTRARDYLLVTGTDPESEFLGDL
ncbi:MAG: UvrD-helicase domain-containing protein [Candidatus Sericytochromatia bacterium]